MRIALVTLGLALTGAAVAHAAPRGAYDLVCHGDELISDRVADLPFHTRLRVDPGSGQVCQGACLATQPFDHDGGAVIAYASDRGAGWRGGATQVRLFQSERTGRVIYIEEDHAVCAGCRTEVGDVASIHAVCVRAAFSGFPVNSDPPVRRHWARTYSGSHAWSRDFSR